MQMIGQQNSAEEQKNKRMLKILTIVIILSLILIVALFLLNTYIESKALKMYIDNQMVQNPESFVVFDEQEGEQYFPIEMLSKRFGYTYYRGEYWEHNEDLDKCYIQNDNEVAGFYQDSNKVYKVDTTKEGNDYENYSTSQNVKNINGVLYASAEAIKIGMNVIVSYDETSNTVELFSVAYLIEAYKSKVGSFGYTSISSGYNEQKAVVDGILIVEKDRKYGAITTNGEVIIGAKYDSIEYLQNTKEFIVTDLKKVGILSSSGQTKVKLQYDSIKLLDKELRLWLVSDDNKYGVLDKNGNTLIHLELDKIGIDLGEYVARVNLNGMFLFNNFIPAQKGDKWGAYDKSGKVILPFEYATIGSVTAAPKDKVGDNVLLISEVNGIVIGKNVDGVLKYGIVNSSGGVIAPVEFDRIYSVTNEGVTEYFVQKGETSTKINIVKETIEDDKNKDNNMNTTNTI